MEENLSALRVELAAFEEEEARLSAERRHLHPSPDSIKGPAGSKRWSP
jgi:hypothetical protein